MLVNKGQDKIELVCRDHTKRYVVCNKFKIYGTAEPLLQERSGRMLVCERGSKIEREEFCYRDIPKSTNIDYS